MYIFISIFSIALLLIIYLGSRKTSSAIISKTYEMTVIVISSCNENQRININTTLLYYKFILLRCNISTNHIDSYEAGLMLDLIIKEYENKHIMKYIFIHDHEIAWHYEQSIYERIKYLKKVNYIENTDFGGLFCHYMVFGCNKSYEWLYPKVIAIDKFMRNNNYTHMSLHPISSLKKVIMPCCSTFVVDRKNIIKNSKDIYINLRKGLRIFVQSGGHNKVSAQYMEYMWIILFGINNMSIPPDCKNESYINP